jgi:predicted RNA-binding Zn-ribbon protein involved in translation (DUF1610 family)
MAEAQRELSPNPPCPHCGEDLRGEDLERLQCPGCGEELPPRLGI